MVFWIKFQAVWQVPAATALPWSAMEFAGLGRLLTRRNLWIMSVPSLVALLLMLTNYHDLIWTAFRMTDHVVQVFGIGNWVLTGYAFLLILTAVVVLFWLALRSHHLRWPAMIMLLGMVVAFGLYSLASIDEDLLRPGERVLVVLGPLSLSYALAFFRFHILDPVPIAREAVLAQMREGMLVIDLQGRVVESNTAAEQTLATPRAELLGRPVAEVLPSDAGVSLISVRHPAMSEINLGTGDATRHYNMNTTRLVDRRGEPAGHLLLLHDVTDQKRAQTKVVEQERMVATLEERERLARELHDGLSQALAYVGMQAQAIGKWLRDGNTARAEGMVGRLAEVAKDAHADVRESILGLRTGSAPEWSFIPTLRHYLDSFQTNYGVRTELSLSGSIGEDDFGPDAGVQLLRVIQEALTNARKHGGARNAHIAFEHVGGRAVIRITDDGSGFDPTRPAEDGGSHFGLAFMRERMEQIGGSVRIESAPGSKTLVELEAPLQGPLEGTK